MGWRVLSNHGLVLVCLARNPEMTLREIGDWVGVTERTAHGIVKDLTDDGYLSRTRESGRNRYEIHGELPLRHPMMGSHTVAELLAAIGNDEQASDNGGRSQRRRGERPQGSHRAKSRS